MARERGIIKMIFTNFINSFRPRQIKGTFKGEDRFGNKYFEILADRRTGKTKTSRWFEPSEKEKFDQELSPEWEAWLRGRRKEIPSQEEILKNQAIAEMTRSNVAELESKKLPQTKQLPAPPEDPDKKVDFPKYDEFELSPGVPTPGEKKP